MVYVDIPKVKGKMAEKGYTITALAKKVGVNRNTMATYLEKPGKLPYGVVSKLATILCDTPDEAARIFFARDLRKTKD